MYLKMSKTLKGKSICGSRKMKYLIFKVLMVAMKYFSKGLKQISKGIISTLPTTSILLIGYVLTDQIVQDYGRLTKSAQELIFPGYFGLLGLGLISVPLLLYSREYLTAGFR